MACCLMAQSHYLNQCWLIIICDIHLRVISQEVLMKLIRDTCLEITLLNCYHISKGTMVLMSIHNFYRSERYVIRISTMMYMHGKCLLGDSKYYDCYMLTAVDTVSNKNNLIKIKRKLSMHFNSIDVVKYYDNFEQWYIYTNIDKG